jgi:hypothetical protein
VCSCLFSMIGVLAVHCRRRITPWSTSSIIATSGFSQQKPTLWLQCVLTVLTQKS